MIAEIQGICSLTLCVPQLPEPGEEGRGGSTGGKIVPAPRPRKPRASAISKGGVRNEQLTYRTGIGKLDKKKRLQDLNGAALESGAGSGAG